MKKSDESIIQPILDGQENFVLADQKLELHQRRIQLTQTFGISTILHILYGIIHICEGKR